MNHRWWHGFHFSYTNCGKTNCAKQMSPPLTSNDDIVTLLLLFYKVFDTEIYIFKSLKTYVMDNKIQYINNKFGIVLTVVRMSRGRLPWQSDRAPVIGDDRNCSSENSDPIRPEGSTQIKLMTWNETIFFESFYLTIMSWEAELCMSCREREINQTYLQTGHCCISFP